jgi:hypothetical protein
MGQYSFRSISNKFLINSAKCKCTELPADHIRGLALKQASPVNSSNRKGYKNDFGRQMNVLCYYSDHNIKSEIY